MCRLAEAYPEGNPLSAPLMTVAQSLKEDLGLRYRTWSKSDIEVATIASMCRIASAPTP